MTEAASELIQACLQVITGATGVGLAFGVIAGMIRDGLER